MDIILAIFLGLFVIGAGVAIYEWRSKRNLMKHDLSRDQTAGRDAAKHALEQIEAAHDRARFFQDR